MRKISILVLCCVILSSTTGSAQTGRSRGAKRGKPASGSATTKATSAEMQAGRERVASQIKTLTQFLYLLGGVAKGIESVDQAVRNREGSSVAIEQNERNKAKVRESIRNVRAGLDNLEAGFRSSTALKPYHPNLEGIGRISETAESLAGANRFDEAGKSLLKAVSQLADALVAMR